VLRSALVGCGCLVVILVALTVLSAILVNVLHSTGIMRTVPHRPPWVLVRVKQENAHPYIGSLGGYVPASWRTIANTSQKDRCRDSNGLKLCDYATGSFDVDAAYLSATHAGIAFSLYHYRHPASQSARRYLVAFLPAGARLSSCRYFHQTRGSNGPAHVCLYMYERDALLVVQYLSPKRLDKVGFGAPTQGLIVNTRFYFKVGYSFVKP
jgi:hypothetical protein